PRQRATLSHGIRRMGQNPSRQTLPEITTAVAQRILEQGLPHPSEQIDNLILWLGQQAEADGSPLEVTIPLTFGASRIGAVDKEGVGWGLKALEGDGLITFRRGALMTMETLTGRTRVTDSQKQEEEEEEELYEIAYVTLALPGWKRYEELQRHA